MELFPSKQGERNNVQCLSFKQAELVALKAELQFEFLSRLVAHFIIFKILI